MKIRIKLILIVTSVIILTALPLSFLFLRKQHQTILKQIINEGFNSAEILSRTTANILLMNGGKISSAQIDCREMMDILKPFYAKGMVYADSFIISQNKEINGKIIAYLKNESYSFPSEYGTDKLSKSTLENILTTPFWREITFSGIDDSFFEMASSTPLPGGSTVIIGRVFYSKNAILDPLVQYINVMIITIFSIIFVMIVVGLITSTFITRPIVNLAKGVEKIESGDLTYEVPILSKDELGSLGIAFNRMAKVLALKISELEEMNRSLARMDAIKDEFLANTSHELKTPLNGIVGIAQSLLDGASGKLDESLQQNLALIVASGKRLAGLINNILDFSRIKNMDIVLSRKAVDLHSIITIVFSLTSPIAKKKQISLTSTIDPGKILIYGDENRLQQIFLNLVDNAIKFTDQGFVKISANIKGDIAEIQIADSGIGIPPEKHNDIFEPFVQADGSIARRHGGSGLGLAITKKLVELHGGSISVSSVPHRGTTFIVQLPICKDQSSADKPCGEIPFIEQEETHNDVTYPMLAKNKESEGNILVVDDDIINIQVLINHLTLAGYDVRVAKSGQQALDMIFSNSYIPDLILLDIMMPVMTGFEVCKIVRETYQPLELPIIMLTARTNTEDIRASFELGANDYITKPFDKTELLLRVKNAIELKRFNEKHRHYLEIQRDLHIAREIQKQILPKKIPQLNKIKIAASYLPMETIGGDYYDFHIIDNNKIGILVADVVGHGISAAMLGTMIKIAFSLNHHNATNPSKLLSSLHNELTKYMEHLFITAHYIVIDCEHMQCSFSSAGHWPALLYQRALNSFVQLHTRGKPLGTIFATEFISANYPLQRGDRIFIFTDGLVECRNKNGELLGEERLQSFFLNTMEFPPEAATSSIIAQAFQWTEKNENYFNDDVCLLCIDIQ